MKIQVIASQVSDNFFYLLSAEDGSDGLLIDPVDANAALDAIEREGVTLKYLVNTHGHPDHTRGNAAVCAKTGVAVWAHTGDKNWIGSVDHILEPGQKLSVGGTSLEVLYTPGHTPGHISLHCDGHLFCGDTVFVGGAGNCRFGGNPPQLHATYRGVLADLPDQTIVYPGHNYAVRNLEFGLSLDPNNESAQSKLVDARALAASNDHCLATLGEERSYNPFFRTEDPDVIAGVKSAKPDLGDAPDSEAVFVALRALRDVW